MKQPIAWFANAMLVMAAGMFTAGCDDAVGPVPVPIEGSTFIMENRLLTPVSLTINRVAVGTVDAGATRTIRRGDLGSAQVEFVLVHPTFNGTGAGDSMSGIWRFDAVDFAGDGDKETLVIGNELREGTTSIFYFAPLITNSTGVPITIGINMGTVEENRTGVTLQAGESRRFIGYYRLFLNTNVRAYNPSAAYSPLLFVEKELGIDFTLDTQSPLSGAAEIVFTEAPPAARLNDDPMH